MSRELITGLRNVAKNFLSQTAMDEITVTDKDGNSKLVHGIITIHNSVLDVETGLSTNSELGHCLLHLAELVESGLECFKGKDATKPYLKGFKCEFVDGNGIDRVFLFDDVRPSETLGTISVIFGAYSE